jgi:serine/threonine-protein kinase
MPVARAESARQPGSWWRSSELPADLEAKHCRRVANFAGMVALLTLIVAVVDFLTIGEDEIRSGNLVVRITQAFVFVLSVALFLVARGHHFSHSLIMKLSLVYEVLLCAVASLGSQWFNAAVQGTFAAVTITCVFIAVFPLIVPTPPLHTLFAALASAATGPLALKAVSWMGVLDPRGDDYLVVSIFHTISVVVAVYGSQAIYGLHRDVAEARELGSYRLGEALGKGGMGEVWKARHRLLARPAAVKLVRAEASDNLTQRFEREAQVTASLTSPHTVGLFDFGLNDEGTYYYVMELLDGLDLDTLVDKYGPVPPERAVHILIQACKSLGEAHDSGLVHRDIKPANLMICRYGREFDFVKVLDFGLVTLGPERSADAKLTSEGLAAGTPGFMPPELAAGDQVDGRADIYSLGCVAFWLLTGRLVFDAPSPMAMIVAHMKEPAPRPSSCTEIGVPVELDEIVLSCLEKNPGKRPQSADLLIEKLKACRLEAPWTSTRARQWWDTHRPPTPTTTPAL